MTVVVVGAGLAGISAAVRLADAGVRVLLLERNTFLGGRAGSLYNDKAGKELDLGQHVYLYCCERYRALLQRLGTDSLAPLQSPVYIPIFDARLYPRHDAAAPIYASPLPAGLHLAPSFIRYAHLTPKERLNTARLALALLRADRHDPRYGRLTFGAWLEKKGASERAVTAFWNVVTVAALNASVHEVSASWGMMLFQVGLLSDRRAAEVGIPSVPLSRLVAPIENLLTRSGGELRLGSRVKRVIVEGRTARGVELADGEIVEAEAIVLAVPHSRIGELVPETMRKAPYFADLHWLKTRPIIDLHLGFREPVTPPDFRFGVFLHSPVQWVFAHDDGRHLAVSISDPGRVANMSAEAVKRTIVAEVRRLFSAPEPLWTVFKRHQGATFDISPGMDRLRKSQRTPLPRLYAAGDWTATGWPATMEGAVRSGELAANALLEDMGRD